MNKKSIPFSELKAGDTFEFVIDPRDNYYGEIYEACKNRVLRKFTKYQCAIPETGELFAVNPSEQVCKV